MPLRRRPGDRHAFLLRNCRIYILRGGRSPWGLVTKLRMCLALQFLSTKGEAPYQPWGIAPGNVFKNISGLKARTIPGRWGGLSALIALDSGPWGFAKLPPQAGMERTFGPEALNTY